MKRVDLAKESRFMQQDCFAQRRFVLLKGPPGAGKTLWARQLSKESRHWFGARGLSWIWRAVGLSTEQTRGLEREDLEFSRIFRAPHHTVSVSGMRGRVLEGWFPIPGELTLAHGGVLFLDEVTEFSSEVLADVLSAVKYGAITLRYGAISEGNGCMIPLPACFSLVVSTNPCPCGRRGSSRFECVCSSEALERHARRLAPFEEFCEKIELPEREMGTSG